MRPQSLHRPSATREPGDAGRLNANAKRQWTLKGWHVLAIFCSFFGVVFATNAVFVTIALTTFSGRDTQDAYRKGLAYNERVAEARVAEARGWEAELAPTADRAVRVTVRDAVGTPVSGLRLTGTFGRPATNRFDEPLRFAEGRRGEYLSKQSLPATGAWIINVSSQQLAPAKSIVRSTTSGAKVRLKERIWLSP